MVAFLNKSDLRKNSQRGTRAVRILLSCTEALVMDTTTNDSLNHEPHIYPQDHCGHTFAQNDIAAIYPLHLTAIDLTQLTWKFGDWMQITYSRIQLLQRHHQLQ